MDISYDNADTKAAVDEARKESWTFDAAMDLLENDHSVLLNIKQGDLGDGVGLVDPGFKNAAGQMQVNVTFDFRNVSWRAEHPYYQARGGITRQDVVAHELFGHAAPESYGVRCNDAPIAGSTTCAVQRENIIRAEMHHLPRTN